MSKDASFTGRKRRMRTRWSVRAADTISRRLITLGGIGTIVAVSTVFLSLFYVVAPLFYPAQIRHPVAYPVPWGDGKPVRVDLDEYRTTGWSLFPDGRLQIFRLDNGDVLQERRLFEGAHVTAASFWPGTPRGILGFDDGTIRLVEIGFETSFREAYDVEESLRQLKPGQVATMDQAVVQRTPQGQFRLQRVTSKVEPPVAVAPAAVRLLDHVPPADSSFGEANEVLVCYTDDRRVQFVTLTRKENAFTGAVSYESQSQELPVAREAAPLSLLVRPRGQGVLVIWEDGDLLRFDTRDPSAARVVERRNLSTGGTPLTRCGFILGRETILCGDRDGRLSAWFLTRHQRAIAGDGYELSRVHELPTSAEPVISLAPSQRSRLVAVGYQDGTLRVFHVTTNQLVAETRVPGDEPLELVDVAPKQNGLLALTASRLWHSDFDPKHPEASLAALFQPVWYENYAEPVHLWQSSFGGVGPEMKLGMWPLVFGTLKATFYTMLFGAPLALMAAVYTSEFLESRYRARVKPVVETMASLPSVVLGFLAALVFAPIVKSFVPAALAAFFTIPATVLLASYLWQLLPKSRVIRLQRFRLLFVFCTLPLGFLAALALGPWVERLLFAGDVIRWLNGQIGTGVGAWLLLLLPLSALVTAMLSALYVNRWMRSQAERWTRGQFARVNAAKFLLGALFALLLALVLSWLLDAVGLDPRGTFVGTYDQRNALVVGFVMGFAVIPIIFTIADDALTTVPNHLRSASLACGATPWQTAVRVVIPTAMSGLFSALMIGLGRAVGETMIVVMAGGSTPIVDLNIFNGFRTLSANIAIELPEAVRNSTHYRTLFLAALALFVLTFFVNTVAEIVRLRFRRRAYQL